MLFSDDWGPPCATPSRGKPIGDHHCLPAPVCDTFTYMTSLTLRIPEKLEMQLEAESKARGISKSDVVREALERDLKVQAWRRLREQFRPHLERQGIFTEADVFKCLGEEL